LSSTAAPSVIEKKGMRKNNEHILKKADIFIKSSPYT
jgi:hypothetical protein